MKNVPVCLLLLVAAFGCRKNDSDPGILAVVDYSLPVDGCDWSVRINDSTYVPSLQTIPLLIDFARKQNPESYTFYDTVYIRYQPTLQRRTVQCGWGRTLAASEITVSEIRVR